MYLFFFSNRSKNPYKYSIVGAPLNILVLTNHKCNLVEKRKSHVRKKTYQFSESQMLSY